MRCGHSQTSDFSQRQKRYTLRHTPRVFHWPPFPFQVQIEKAWWHTHHAVQKGLYHPTPGPADCPKPKTPAISGGRFNTSNSKNDVEWMIYHASSMPGPGEYAHLSKSLPVGGGRFNMSNAKSSIEWTIHEASKVKIPCALRHCSITHSVCVRNRLVLTTTPHQHQRFMGVKFIRGQIMYVISHNQIFQVCKVFTSASILQRNHNEGNIESITSWKQHILRHQK